MRCIVFTLTLALSHQGRGECGWCCLVVCPALPLWIADQVRNDATMRCIVFTLTLALPHQGREDLVGCVGLLLPRPSPLDCGSNPQ